MARERRPEREKARRIWEDSGGKLNAREVAEAVGGGVTAGQVRKWKSADKWKDRLAEAQPKRKRGGQPGNKNAAGAGAPKENRNAETHGAYTTVRLADLTPEQRTYIQNLTLDTERNMLAELQSLIAKEADLSRRIADLQQKERDALFVERDILTQREAGETHTVIKGSAFDREIKLESELSRIHGRIIKLLDSIKSYELENRRIRLEERKYNLAKQKLSGAYEINPETGEIDDEKEEKGENQNFSE